MILTCTHGSLKAEAALMCDQVGPLHLQLGSFMVNFLALPLFLIDVTNVLSVVEVDAGGLLLPHKETSLVLVVLLFHFLFNLLPCVLCALLKHWDAAFSGGLSAVYVDDDGFL